MAPRQPDNPAQSNAALFKRQAKHERKRRIYIVARPFWSAELSHAKMRKHAAEFVTRHRHRFLNLLSNKSRENIVIDTLWSLIRKGVLGSENKAKKCFPDLFHSLGDDAVEQDISTPAVSAPSQELMAPEVRQAQMLTSQADRQTLFPSYLDMQCQHLLLTFLQRLLEDCCYQFATRWIPEVLTEKGWDCAAAVELSQWAKVLPRNFESIPKDAIYAQDEPALRNTLLATVPIRNVAVHRDPTKVLRIDQMLDQGLELTRMLNDLSCTSRLRELKQHLSTTVKDLEVYKDDLEQGVSSQLEDIDKRQEELNAERENVKSGILCRYKANIGRITTSLSEHCGSS